MKLFITISLLLIGNISIAQTQLELNEKASTDYKKADIQLNIQYKKLLNLLGDSKDKERLRQAQRSWIQYRDAHCTLAESAYEGGSLQPLIYFNAMKELTEQRVLTIKSLIEDFSPK
jgi:uncharacterized protein YecT (DUF1311 family)